MGYTFFMLCWFAPFVGLIVHCCLLGLVEISLTSLMVFLSCVRVDLDDLCGLSSIVFVSLLGPGKSCFLVVALLLLWIENHYALNEGDNNIIMHTYLPSPWVSLQLWESCCHFFGE